jgi:hypothetical protein
MAGAGEFLPSLEAPSAFPTYLLHPGLGVTAIAEMAEGASLFRPTI